MDDDGVGARIRRFRRARGLSLDQASGLASMSKPYLSRIERGERSVDSRALLLRIASALEVSVADLTGQPYVPRDRQHSDAQRGVSGLRLALLDPSGPTPDASEVTHAVDSLPEWLAKCDLVAQAELIPDLMRATELLALRDNSPDAHRRVAAVAHGAVFFLRNLGELDLAVMAAERMRTAAQQSGDPATIGFSTFSYAHALVPAGAARRAAELAVRTADATTGDTPEEIAARGSCLLVAASTNAALGNYDVARAQITAADELASRLTVTTVVASHTSFSDWNATMYRVSVEVDAGDPAAALKAARPLMAAPIHERERMSYLWVDVGRAFSQMDKHREAIDAFRRAERTAPLRVRLSPVVRDSVRELMDRAYRRSAGVELRGLAERCGVLSGD